MKLSTKLTLLFSSLVLVIGVVISYIVYTSGISILEYHIKDRLKNQTFHSMDKIDMMLFERYEHIRTIATDPVICSRGSTLKQITERLIQLKNDLGYDSLAFYDPNKVCIADTSETNIGKKHSAPGIWNGIGEGKDISMGVVKSDFLNMVIFHFASVVKDKDGAVIGFVVSRMPVENLYEIVKQAVGIYNVEHFLIDLVNKDGLILYSNYNREGILRDLSPDWKIVKRAMTAGIKVDSIKYTNPKVKIGEEILAFAHEKGYRGFKGNDWTLISYVPISVAFAFAVKLKNDVITILLLSSFPALFGVFLLSRRFSQPVEKIAIASKEIAEGNLDVMVEVTSRDEIGQLAEAFNKMVVEIKENRDRLLSYNKELEKAVEERTSELQAELLKHKLTGEALRQSEDRFHRLADSTLEGIAIHEEGKIIEINKTFVEMFRYKPSEVRGMHVLELAAPESRDLVKGKYGSGYEQPYEAIGLRKDGTTFIAEVCGKPIKYKGHTTRVTAIRDITDRKRMEGEIQKAREIESLGILAAGIAHDFNNLLTVILGNISLARMLLYTGDKDKIFNMLKNSEHACEDAAELSNRLLTFAKGGVPFKKKTSISPILKETTALSLSGSNISSEFIIPDDLHFVEIDERQLKQVINGMVMNARESMIDGGTIRISAGNVAVSKNDNLPLKEGNYVKVAIKDTGKGISEENIGKIFDPYFSTKEMGGVKGQGLGLTICYSIIKRHNGHITVNSEVVKGTTFHIYLPACEK